MVRVPEPVGPSRRATEQRWPAEDYIHLSGHNMVNQFPPGNGWRPDSSVSKLRSWKGAVATGDKESP